MDKNLVLMNIHSVLDVKKRMILKTGHGKKKELYPETIIYSKKSRVKCSGENNDHPLVYYTIPEGGEVVCGYCDIKFRKEEEYEIE